jgi:hypothetical protein
MVLIEAEATLEEEVTNTEAQVPSAEEEVTTVADEVMAVEFKEIMEVVAVKVAGKDR